MLEAEHLQLLRHAESLAGSAATTREDYRDLLEAAYSLPFRERSGVLARVYYSRLSRAVATADHDDGHSASFACHLAIGLVGCDLVVEADSFFEWGWGLGNRSSLALLLGEYCAALSEVDAFPELLRWTQVFTEVSATRKGQRLLSRFMLCRALAGVGRTDEARAILDELRDTRPSGSPHPLVADIERLLAATASTKREPGD